MRLDPTRVRVATPLRGDEERHVLYVASGALGMLLPLLGAMRNAAIIRHRAPPLWLLPLLGAMRNHPVIIFDNVGELLLPLLGAMRNPIARELAGDDAATLLPLLGAMRNARTTAVVTRSVNCCYPS